MHHWIFYYIKCFHLIYHSYSKTKQSIRWIKLALATSSPFLSPILQNDWLESKWTISQRVIISSVKKKIMDLKQEKGNEAIVTVKPHHYKTLNMTSFSYDIIINFKPLAVYRYTMRSKRTLDLKCLFLNFEYGSLLVFQWICVGNTIRLYWELRI